MRKSSRSTSAPRAPLTLTKSRHVKDPPLSATRIGPHNPVLDQPFPTEAERRKDEFVVTLAHEVRQPLAAILTALDVMRLPVASGATDRAHQVIRRQVRQIDRLVEDLMEATRWARGTVTLDKTRIDFREVITEAAHDVMRSVEQHGHELIVASAPEPVWVDADRGRLQQLLSNLLRNAVKYTDRGGRIWLTSERQASTVVVRVRDTGRGMEPEALHHIFDLFTQVSPFGSEGLGIGLSVVREIVKLHDGTIEARSAGLGQGSEFIVTLPISTEVA